MVSESRNWSCILWTTFKIQRCMRISWRVSRDSLDTHQIDMATSNSLFAVVFNCNEIRLPMALVAAFHFLFQIMELGFVWVCKRMITLWRKPAADRHATMPSIDRPLLSRRRTVQSDIALAPSTQLPKFKILKGTASEVDYTIQSRMFHRHGINA